MAEPTPTLTTARLLLRPLGLPDAPAIQALFPRWEIVRHLASQVPWPYPADGALAYLRDIVLPAMADGAAWHWSIRPLSAPDRLIGCISLLDQPGDNRGFWLDPAWQRQGLMTEATDRVTEFWFGTLGRPILQTPKAAANEPSRRISERAGMRLVGQAERDYVAGRLPGELWEITREEWRSRRRGLAAGMP